MVWSSNNDSDGSYESSADDSFEEDYEIIQTMTRMLLILPWFRDISRR